MRAHAPALSIIHRLFAIFVALAVLLAPAAVRAQEAAAPSHHAQMMEQSGHCQMPPGGSTNHDKSAGKSCCISISMAVSIAPGEPLLDEPARGMPAVPAVASFQRGYCGEIATPPPRRS